MSRCNFVERLPEAIGLTGGRTEDDLRAVAVEKIDVSQIPDIAVNGNKYIERQALKRLTAGFPDRRSEAAAAGRSDSVN
jgi:hypothetical protein